MMNRTMNSRSGSGRSAPASSSLRRVGSSTVAIIRRRPVPILMGVAVLGAVGAFGWNVLVKQPTRHPAPLFASNNAASPAPVSVEPPRRPEMAAAPLPVPRPETTSSTTRSPEPARASANSDPIGAMIRSGDPERRNAEARITEAKTADAKIAEARIAEAKTGRARIQAAQKALSKLSFGRLAPDGKRGAATRQALERFERDRNLPVTGSLGPRTKQQLAARSGVQVE